MHCHSVPRLVLLVLLLACTSCADFSEGGGVCAAITDPRPTVQVYDPSGFGWRFGTPLLVDTYSVRCTTVSDQIYAMTESSFFRLDLVAKSWVPLAFPVGFGGRGSDIAALGSDIYFLSGGVEVEVYDTATDTWTPGPPLLEPRWSPRAVVVGGILYAMAGGSTATLEALDPAVGAWSYRANLPADPVTPAVETAGGRIYVMWGTVWIYDPAADSWTDGPDMPAFAYRPEAAAIGDDIYVIGSFGNGDHKRTYRLRTTTLVWQESSPRRRSRYDSGAAAADGFIYSVGGHAPNPCTP
ncbi:MAG: DUF1668 domain-containing protein [Planctomycetota bacterium]|nr:DUF1668 domain-containing protein [Planctomycetota bacterium]